MVDVTNADIRSTYTPVSLTGGSVVYFEAGTSPYAFTLDELQAWLDGQVYTSIELQRYSETTYAASATVDRADGGIQSHTMTANSTFTLTIAEGESLTYRLAGGDTYTMDWQTNQTIVWMENTTPTLTANDWLTFWVEGGTIYGAYVGSVA